MKTNSWALCWIIFIKELRDNLRDRRSLISTLISAIISPVLIAVLIIIVGRSLFRDQVESATQLPVVGAENAPELIDYLEQEGLIIVPAPSDPEEAVRNGNVGVVLIILDGYQDAFHEGEPAVVQLMRDSSRQSTLADVQRIRILINQYDQTIAILRLMARGINPEIIRPLAVEDVDMATPQSQVLIFLNMLPYFVVMVIFMGGLHVVLDTTAGERERSSLEPLLILPVPRWVYVIGKMLASLPFAILSVVATLGAFGAVFNLVPLEEFIGIQMTIDLVSLVWVFIISIPMIFLAAALQMIIATFARTFKEAQTYTGFLPLIPALPGLGLAFLPVKPALWTMLIPTFGQQILINQFMRGEPVSMVNLLVSTLVTLAAAFLLNLVAIRLFERERIIFGAR
jgi:sodium transport system permease protein